MQHKWHHEKRNVMIGAIVVIQDCNLPRGQWKLGMVIKTFPGIDKRFAELRYNIKIRTVIHF